MDIEPTNHYLHKKLQQINVCLNKNRDAQSSLRDILSMLKPKLEIIKETIAEHKKSVLLGSSNIDFYKNNLPFFANNKLKVLMHKIYKMNNKSLLTVTQELQTRNRLGLTMLDDSDKESSSDEESELEWFSLTNMNKKAIEFDNSIGSRRSLTPETHKNETPTKKRRLKKLKVYSKYYKPQNKVVKRNCKRSLIRRSTLGDEHISYLKMNWGFIEQHFIINYENLKANDYHKISEKLNCTSYLIATEKPITAFEVYKQINNVRKQNQPKQIQWSDEDNSKLIELTGLYQELKWNQIEIHFNNKTASECNKQFIKLKGRKQFTFEDDIRIIYGSVVYAFKWIKISKLLFIRTRKEQQIRERFVNILDPVLTINNPSNDEIFLAAYYRLIGKSWTWIMVHHLPHITDNKILRHYEIFKNNNKELHRDIERIVQWQFDSEKERKNIFRIEKSN